MSLHPCFDEGNFCRFAKESLPTEIGKGRHWTSVFFCGCTSNAPRFAQGQPNGYIFSNERTWWNNWTERAEFNVPTCGKIAVCQLCRERQPLWKSHDGLNVTCLDQCHGVRFHGTSTSQGWRKKIVVQSTVWIWSISLHECFDEGDFCRFAKESLPTEIGKGRHWTSVFFCGCTSNNQDSLKASPMATFKWKNLMEQLDRACWVQRANLWPHYSLSAVQRQPFPDCILCKCFSVDAQATAKIRPRPAQGL